MAKEKFTNKEKKLISKMNLHGEGVDAFADFAHVCTATVYTAIGKGDLLNRIENLERFNREKDVTISLLRQEISFLKRQKAPQPLVRFLN